MVKRVQGMFLEMCQRHNCYYVWEYVQQHQGDWMRSLENDVIANLCQNWEALDDHKRLGFMEYCVENCIHDWECFLSCQED